MLPQRIVPLRHGDARGWFSETYSRKALTELGIPCDFVQDNHSMSGAVGTLRGIHFQRPPHAQAKLVRCVAGAIWDVAVDLRHGSPSYGQWVAATLSAAGGEQLFIPAGFGHGFLTLTDNAEVAYKASDYYAPDCEGGVAWDDPAMAIAWPIEHNGPTLSDKDCALPRLCDLPPVFAYDGQPLAALSAQAALA